MAAYQQDVDVELQRLRDLGSDNQLQGNNGRKFQRQDTTQSVDPRVRKNSIKMKKIIS
jgi:hypothetical protein